MCVTFLDDAIDIQEKCVNKIALKAIGVGTFGEWFNEKWGNNYETVVKMACSMNTYVRVSTQTRNVNASQKIQRLTFDIGQK